MMVKIKNIAVKTRMHWGYCVTFETDDARYHVFVDPATRKIFENSLYKHPLEQIRGTRARVLNADNAANTRMIATLLQAVSDAKLIENFEAEQAAKAAAENRSLEIAAFVRASWIARMRGQPVPDAPVEISDEEFRSHSIALAESL